MGLFSRKESGATALIIDIGSSSVGGAYARFTRGAVPEVLYVIRVPVARREGEATSLEGMERALNETCDLLVGEGGPAALRAIGSAHIDRIIVSTGPPWEEALVRVLHIEDGKPFTFTRSLVKDSDTGKEAASGRRMTEDQIILVKLNGYETRQPYGKRASQAEVTVLTSTIAEEAAAAVDQAVSKAFHTRALRLRAFLPAAFSALASLYPHQKDHLIIVAGGDATNIALVSKGVLAGIRSIPLGVNPGVRSAEDRTDATAQARLTDEWLAATQKEAMTLAGDAGMPGTVFLITHQEARDALMAALSGARWRSDAMTVVPISAAHLSSAVRTRADTDPDTGLTLLALAEARAFEEEALEGDTPVAA